MAERNILREYLLKIGFKADDAQWKKLQNTVDATTDVLADLATTAITAGTAIGIATVKTAQGLEKMYYAALRTGSSVRSLQAFQFGAKQIGISAESAQGAVEGLAKALRNGPGKQAQLLSFGINPNQDPTKVLEQLVNVTRRMPHYIGAQLMQSFGVDEDTFTMLSQPGALEKLRAGEKKRTDIMGRDRVDPDAVARQSKDFMNHMREVGATIEDVKETTASRLEPSVQKLADAFDRLAASTGKLDAATDGWSTKIGAVVAGIGLKEVAGFGLKQIGKKLFGTAAKTAGKGAAGELAGEGAALGLGELIPVVALGTAIGFAVQDLDKRYGTQVRKKFGLTDDPSANRGIIKDKFSKLLGGVQSMGEAGAAEFIKFNEGYRGYNYKDQAGNPTIGYGHKIRPGEHFGKDFNKDSASVLLGRDAAAAMAAVKRMVKVALSNQQLKALTDLDYNIGDKKFGDSTLLKKLNSGDYAGASNEFARWNKVQSANGYVTSSGLTARRGRDKALFDKAVNQKTEINVHGVTDPNAAARAVAKQQDKVNSDLVRNVAGVVDTVGN